MMKFYFLDTMPFILSGVSYLWLVCGFMGCLSSLFSVNDELSYLMIFLTFVLFVSYTIYFMKENKTFMPIVCFYLPLLLLFFLCENILMFYMLFELSILPIFLMILGWGNQPERLFASNYLLFYTLLFSFPLMVVFMYIMFNYSLNWSNLFADWFTWIIVMIPFFVKIPIYTFHLWLPKAHVEAPVLGSMILASILLKTGGYGLLKVLNLSSVTLPPFMTSFILFMIFLASVLCFLQTDLKKFIAYSSITHMTIILALATSEYVHFRVGSIFLMISHGVLSNSLFFLVGLFSMESLSRLLYKQSNLMLTNPVLWFSAMMVLFLNAGMPPSLSMLNEIMLFIISNLLWNWNFLICLFLFIALIYYPIWFMSNMNSSKNNALNNSSYVSTYDVFLLCYLPFSMLFMWSNSTLMF